MTKVIKAVVGVVITAVGVVTGNFALVAAGVSMVGGALLGPKVPKTDRTAVAAQLQLGEVPRAAIVGRAGIDGSLVDAFNYGGKYGTDWEVLVIALADHECDALEGFFVNESYHAFSADGAVSGFNGQLEVYWRSGTWDQTVPSILTSHGPGWTANDRGRSVAHVVVAYKADEPDAENPVWSGRRPQFKWVVRGLKCYSARLDTSVGGSGAHRRDNPATWEWTENLIDIRYNWVRGIYAGNLVDQPEMLLIGRGLSDIEAPPANVFARANLCDEVVESEPRYRAGGLILASEAFIDVENAFAAACAGVIVQREGSVEIDPGEARSSVASFDDGNLIVGRSVRYSDIPGEQDQSWVNTVVARFVDPTQRWIKRAAPVKRVIADITADRGPREQSLELDFVTSGKQAQRVAEINRRLGRLWGRGRVPLPPEFSEVEEGDWVTWTSDRHLGGGSKVFRVEAWQSDEGWRPTLTLREIAASVYSDGAPASDTAVGVQQDPPSALEAPGVSAWTATAGALSGIGIRSPALIVTGATDDPAASFVRFEYVQSATVPGPSTEWTEAGTARPSVTRREIPVAANAQYYVAVSYVVDGIAGARRVLGPIATGAFLYADGTPVEDLQPAEPGATEGAVVPTPGSGASGNVKDEGGNLYDPGELLNASMELTPSGQLQFRPLPGSDAVPCGQITLPDIGAASEAALRRAEDDVDALANAVATALDEASRTRETFTDAGFFVDEATGQFRIHAVEQTTERLNTVDIRLDAAEASINLRATTNYVDQAIAAAVLDPSQTADLDAIFVRLTAAELDIDGLEATVTTLATVTELTALTGRVTTAESELDALEGTVSTKVDTTTFNALETRVTSAETTLTALGDTAQIVNAVTSIRLIEREVDANAEGALAALVQDDRNQRDQVAAVASARQELRTEITDGLTAEATARLALQAEVANNAASLATESLTRASEDAALASQISALEASTDTSVAALTASIGAEQTARTNADSALAADITALEADLATETSQRTAAITAEQQARVDGDAAEAAARTALAARVTTAEADIDANTAAITAEQTARATADSAIAASVTALTTTVDENSATLTTFGESIDGLEARFGVRLDVNGRVTGFVQNNDGTQGNFVLVADNFEIIDPDLGPGGTPLTVFQILNGVISGSALNFDDVIGDNRPENNADVTATAQRSIVPQFPIIEVRQYEAGNVGDRTVSHFAKRGETAIGGGTWSLPSVLLGAGTASINSSTGLVTLSGVAQSGAYTVRYTHTDGGQTELPVNVTFIPQEATVRSISATPSIVTWFQSSTTSRTVAHVAAQGSTTLTGGTWSLVSTSGMTASINSSTGLVTVSNATGNGNYRVRYTHTDTVETELVVNLTYYPASDPGAPTDPNYNEP